MSSNHLNKPNAAHKRPTSIDMTPATAIDINPKLQSTAFTNKLKDYGYLTPDEFGIFRDPEGQERAMDGRIINISKDDISDILQVANGQENLFMQQHLNMLRENCQQQPQPSIDTDMSASIDGRFAAVHERLNTFEAMHDKYSPPIMRTSATIDAANTTPIDVATSETIGTHKAAPDRHRIRTTQRSERDANINQT
ncbi:hypothetical protein Bca101_067448 [Brassica carinata]